MGRVANYCCDWGEECSTGWSGVSGAEVSFHTARPVRSAVCGHMIRQQKRNFFYVSSAPVMSRTLRSFFPSWRQKLKPGRYVQLAPA